MLVYINIWKVNIEIKRFKNFFFILFSEIIANGI